MRYILRGRTEDGTVYRQYGSWIDTKSDAQHFDTREMAENALIVSKSVSKWVFQQTIVEVP